MDFEQDATFDDERLPVNILQIPSTPPDDTFLRTGARPPVLRSRRTPLAMPALSSSPTATPLDSSLTNQTSPNSASATTAATIDNSLTQQSCISSPPSPPLSVPKLSGKERKHATSVSKELDHSATSFPLQNECMQPPQQQQQSQQQLDISDFECPLCFQVYLHPVTTTCGHVFCKQCLFRAIKHSSSCPLCRHKIDSSSVTQKYSVNIVLMNVIEKYFPKEHRERVSEEEDLQKSEPPMKPVNTEAEDNAPRPASPSNWGCILPSLRSTCTVLLSCGGF